MPGSIFGPDLLLIFGADTIITQTKEQLIYSCDHCSITCKTSNGIIRWTKDLSKLQCRVISFGQINLKEKTKVKGCDIFVQFKDKTIYGLNSKSGKMKPIDKYIRRLDKNR